MALVSVYIKGIEELERTANRALKSIHEGETAILLKQAKLGKDRIKDITASQQKGSVKHSAQKAAYATAYPPKMNSDAVAFFGIRPKAMPHAHLVEKGHGGPQPAPAHPFVQKARAEIMPEIKENIAKEMGQLVDSSFSSAAPVSINLGVQYEGR
jgi:hypothetical protein